jgi:hypothetical protein
VLIAQLQGERQMTSIDPFQVPTTAQQMSAEDWKALARRNEKRAKRSRHLLLRLRTQIDGLLEADEPPQREAS